VQSVTLFAQQRFKWPNYNVSETAPRRGRTLASADMASYYLSQGIAGGFSFNTTVMTSISVLQ